MCELKSSYDATELLQFSSTGQPRIPSEEDKDHYNTAAGLLQSLSGRLLKTTEKVQVAGWEFEVVDLDGKRIDKVLASEILVIA